MAAKDQYSTNLGLSILPEIDQKQHPQIYLEFLRMRNALRALQGALDTYTGALSEDPTYWNQTQAYNTTRVQNISRIYAIAGEAISLSQQVNFYNNSGVLTARKANATDNTKPARAFCSVPAGVAAGAYGEFILLGVNPYYSGLTPGATYYLHTTSGQITSVAPVTVGNIVQEIGWAIDSNNLWFNPVLNWKQL
jgi:hypothetical protein